MHTVAIIGAGPGGLAAARYLRHVGLAPVLFEQGDGVGGQWRVGAPHSAVWPGMRTNTSRVMTAFSDAEHPAGTAVYPTAEQVGAYLERYAERFGLLEGARFRTQVEAVELADAGHVDASADGTGAWRVRSRGADGVAHVERFDRVVVATGWCRTPVRPKVPGLAGFAGALGVTHAAEYRGPAPFRGRRVLVAGGGISALEVASELALRGAERVVVASRRQRYVIQKLLAGVPADHVAFTRFAALAAETFPPEAGAAALQALVVGTSGRPEQFGAPRPADDFFAAGLTLSQHYLPLVAEGRVTPRPWIERVDGALVTFADGTAEEFDAVVLGTGYAPQLSFLGQTLRAALGAAGPTDDDETSAHDLLAGLHRHTFHPALPGLAFLGLLEQIGPHLPTLELQARWIAYVWGGRVPAPTDAEFAADAKARAALPPDAHMQSVPMQVAARLFAQGAGVEPDPSAWPALARALFFGPLSPASFRLSGPDALPDAAERVAADAAAFGAGADGALTDEQGALLRSLAEARGDAALAALVARLTGPAAGAPADAYPGATPPGARARA